MRKIQKSPGAKNLRKLAKKAAVIPKKSSLGKMTYDELVDYATRYCHDGLLREGGKGLRSAIFMWLNQAIIWSQEQDYEE